MSGLVKAKKYDWKDSNMALFGSDTEKQVKKESAECEPAWQGSGQEVGLQIWRIVKFKVTSWPKEDYGKFFTGDSYIILNTYKDPEGDELLYDVHFWIGQYSTQDEYGTAAYKTVELDTFHDDKPIQHREVQGHESKLFKSYFDSITYLKGGADTGFRRVLPEEYKPRLFRINREGPKKVVSTQVSLSRNYLDTKDVFILDLGLTVYQWNGKECNKDEKYKATQLIQQICSERNGKPSKEVVEEEDIRDNHPFYEALTEDDDDDDQPDQAPEGSPEWKKVCDADGSLDMEDLDCEISKENMSSSDVYIINTTRECFVWIGNDASIDERKNAIPYAHTYLQGTDTPWLSVTVLQEGREGRSQGFLDAVAGCA